MNADQRAILQALDSRMSAKDLHEKLADKFTRPRIMGLLQTLMYRGLTDNRNKLWFRTEAGERIAQRSAD